MNSTALEVDYSIASMQKKFFLFCHCRIREVCMCRYVALLNMDSFTVVVQNAFEPKTNTE